MTILDTIDQEFLFQVIEHNGDISPLLKKYNYTKVASALKFLIEKGYAKYDKEELRITEAGRAEHDKLKKILQRKHNGWISPKIDEKISPIQENDIYLPNNIKNLE
ncbi:MAG: hypothetical protein HXN90_07305 [Prevotella pallens]|nr:hypothetical protein [Prevotella pallens]